MNDAAKPVATPIPSQTAIDNAYARGDFAAVHRLAEAAGTPEALALKAKVSLDMKQVGVGFLALGVSLLVAVWTLSTHAQ